MDKKKYFYSAEEAKAKGRNIRGRPSRKRKARKDSEESSGEEESINYKNGKPGDEDEDNINTNWLNVIKSTALSIYDRRY